VLGGDDIARVDGTQRAGRLLGVDSCLTMDRPAADQRARALGGLGEMRSRWTWSTQTTVAPPAWSLPALLSG